MTFGATSHNAPLPIPQSQFLRSHIDWAFPARGALPGGSQGISDAHLQFGDHNGSKKGVRNLPDKGIRQQRIAGGKTRWVWSQTCGHVIILGALTLACHLSLASFALEVVDPMVGSEQTPFGERRVSGPADGCPHGRAVTSIPYLVKVPNATERHDCVEYGFCLSRQIL